MRQIPSESSIWSAALRAANCRVVKREGGQYPVRWQQHPDSMRYVARDEVDVEPFGVRLQAGDVLEVWWAPNETGYSVAVRSAL
jgi:hypothetical protein